MDRFEPGAGGSDAKHAEEFLGEIAVPGGDGSVDLEMAEHAFDAVAPREKAPVSADGRLTIESWRDPGPDAACPEVGAAGVAVAALVGERGLGRVLRQRDQRVVALAVNRLAAREVEGERPILGVAETMSFTGDLAARAARCLFASPAFAPTDDTWPPTVVESRL